MLAASVGDAAAAAGCGAAKTTTSCCVARVGSRKVLPHAHMPAMRRMSASDTPMPTPRPSCCSLLRPGGGLGSGDGAGENETALLPDGGDVTTKGVP